MIRRLWSEQVRVTFWAWIATLGAAAMLSPLTASKRYLVVGAVGAAAVAATGALLRARRAHLVIVLAAELAVAFEWLILTFARRDAVLGFLPGPDSVSDLRDRWSGYVDFANQYAAPLPQDDDVTMAMAAILVAIGVIVDVVAASWRRAALLGLVFLAVYMTPVSILGGEISVVAFLFGALGYIFLLAADERERLTHWGRQISTAGSLWDQPTEVDEGGLRRNGVRVGLGAVALAAVVPVLIPTLSPHYFGQTGSGGTGGSGDGTVQIQANPALDLRRNLRDQVDEVLLRVTTTDLEPEYFRFAAMDEFTGEEWQVGDRSEDDSIDAGDTIPRPTDPDLRVSTQPETYEVTVDESFDTRWLPLRYFPTSLDIEQSWRVDRTHLDAYAASNDSMAGQSYSFTSEVVLPSRGQMLRAGASPPELEAFTVLPDIPGEFRSIALEVTEGEETLFEKAEALEDWFRSGEFVYSLDESEVTGSNIDDLVDFLTVDKVGYCEQFASAMAIMARTLGIPSRVAVGFLQPQSTGDGTYEFSGTDMHAWPELYFDGVGWTRFEPTPNTADSEGSDPLDFVGTNLGTAPPGGPPVPNTDSPSSEPQDLENQPAGTDAEDDGAGAGGGSNIWWIALLTALGLALIASLPRLARTAVGRRRWSQADGPVQEAEAAWAELRDHVLDLRMDWDSGATPRTIGRSLREQIPDDRARGGQIVTALNRLVLAIEQGRYAREIRYPGGLRAAQSTVADALLSRQTPGRRFLARWLPASLLRSRRRTTVRAERLGELLVSVED